MMLLLLPALEYDHCKSWTLLANSPSCEAVMNYTEMESKVCEYDSTSHGYSHCPIVDDISLLTTTPGARGYKQRAMGSILDHDAGDCQCHL